MGGGAITGSGASWGSGSRADDGEFFPTNQPGSIIGLGDGKGMATDTGAASGAVAGWAGAVAGGVTPAFACSRRKRTTSASSRTTRRLSSSAFSAARVAFPEARMAKTSATTADRGMSKTRQTMASIYGLSDLKDAPAAGWVEVEQKRPRGQMANPAARPIRRFEIVHDAILRQRRQEA
jgi:hypothetical protein